MSSRRLTSTLPVPVALNVIVPVPLASSVTLSFADDEVTDTATPPVPVGFKRAYAVPDGPSSKPVKPDAALFIIWNTPLPVAANFPEAPFAPN